MNLKGTNSFEEKAFHFYQIRFEDSSKNINGLYQLFNATRNIEEKTIIQSLLSLSFIKHKNLKNAQIALESCKEYCNQNQNSIGASYYYFALYRYKFYIDDPNFQNDLLTAFTLFEKFNNHKFASIAAVAIANNSDKIHTTFLEKAIFHSEKSKNFDCILEANICKSSYLKEKYISNPNKETLEQSIKAFDNNLKLVKNVSIQNKMNLAVVYLNYANFLVESNKNIIKVNQLLDTAISIAKQYKILSIFRNSYGIKGIMYLNQNNLEKAESTLLEGINNLNKMPYKEYYVNKNFYKNLKDIAERKKEYHKYFLYDQLYIEAQTKADKIEMDKNIQNAIAKYDINLKEEKIALLTKQNNLKNGLIIAIVGVIGLLIFSFFQFYKANKIKQKYLEKNKLDLQREKEQTQKELMNSVLHLEKKNEILNELKEKLIEQNKDNHSTIHKSIFKTIDAGLVVDDDFEKFKNNFNSIYPEFFEKLQQKANHTLTQLDLKYCGFILMKVTNKEIAQQMNVEPKSIRMARYRIKQKLQLSKEDDLDQFIQKAIL